MSDDNYYDILGVTQNSSQEDIKRAYKKLAVKWHPDRNRGSFESVEIFKKIAKAYEVLGDPANRSKYDAGEDEIDDEDVDPNQLFKSVFGNFFQMHGLGNINMEDYEDPDDIVVDCINYLEADITDLWLGTTIAKQYDRYSECEKCNGYGTKSGKLANCKKCKGSGTVPMAVSPTMTVPVTCQSCNGSCIDKAVAKCAECKGLKFMPETVEVELDIRPGSYNGTKIIVEGEGNIIPPEEVKRYGRNRSDAIFIIKELHHPSFRRGLIVSGKGRLDFADLMAELSISFEESLIGFTKNVPHPSGIPIQVSVSEPCRHGDTIVIERQGMPSYDDASRYGDFFVKIYVDKPEFTPETRKQLSQLFDYTHTQIKTEYKYMTLDDYTTKCEIENEKRLKKSETEYKNSVNSRNFANNSNARTTNYTSNTTNNSSNSRRYETESESDDSIPEAPVVENKRGKDKTPKEATKNTQKEKTPAKRGRKPKVQQPLSDDSDELQISKDPFDNKFFKNATHEAMKSFKHFSGNSDDENHQFSFRQNGNGSFTSTMTHPDGHTTTTTTTRTYVNGKEMSPEELKKLNIDLSNIPELEGIPGLQGLFGIGKNKGKKKITN